MGTPPTPAMLFNLPSDAQQMTMRIVFVLCYYFAVVSFPPNLRTSGSVVYLCLLVFDYDLLVQNACRNRA